MIPCFSGRKGRFKMNIFKWIGKLLVSIFIIGLIAVVGIGAYRGYVTHKQVKDVERWQTIVEEVTEDYQLSDYNDVVMAIILTESKGDHVDVMQSSESEYGQMNAVSSSRESIEIGVKHLSEVLKEAQDKGTDIWTGVQAYNFGSNYIKFISENGGKHSVELAERYSKDILAPMLGNDTQIKYHYLKPRAVMYNGGYLYQNGGNFFYADTVDWNLRMMKIFQELPF